MYAAAFVPTVTSFFVDSFEVFELTVTSQYALTEVFTVDVAVMREVPAAIAVTFPSETVATSSLLEVQVTVLSESERFVPVTVAVKVDVSSTPRLSVDWLKVTPVTLAVPLIVVSPLVAEPSSDEHETSPRDSIAAITPKTFVYFLLKPFILKPLHKNIFTA